jgi:hypothetical protein
MFAARLSVCVDSYTPGQYCLRGRREQPEGRAARSQGNSGTRGNIPRNRISQSGLGGDPKDGSHPCHTGG